MKPSTDAPCVLVNSERSPTSQLAAVPDDVSPTTPWRPPTGRYTGPPESPAQALLSLPV